jgi:hypothetical protein
MASIYEVRLSDGLRCHDVHTKFHKDWFRHSKVNVRDTQTQIGRRSQSSLKRGTKGEWIGGVRGERERRKINK